MATFAKIMITLALIGLSMMARAHRQEEKRFENAVIVVSDDMIMDTHMPVLEADEDSEDDNDGVFRNYRIPEDDVIMNTTSTATTRVVKHKNNVVLISNWPGEGGPFFNL